VTRIRERGVGGAMPQCRNAAMRGQQPRGAPAQIKIDVRV
jgi:hypothetical protein